MTEADFTAFFPQFAGFPPAIVLREYVRQANDRFGDFEPSDMEEARRLYAAHKLTLYAMTTPPPGSGGGSFDPAAIASAGRAESSRHVASRKVGEVSVSYTSESFLSGDVTPGLADLKETAYGLQLLTLLRLYSRSRYIP